MEQTKLQEVLERAQTVAALSDALGNEAAKRVIVAFHTALLKVLENEIEFYEDTFSQEECEGWFQQVICEATAIYAIAVNWPQRDEHGRNPALFAVLDQADYEGGRTLKFEREVRL